MRRIRATDPSPPKGVSHMPQNGVLVPVHNSGNRGRQLSHVAGIATGELGNAALTPALVVIEGVKSLCSGVAGSQFGQSTAFAWDRAEKIAA